MTKYDRHHFHIPVMGLGFSIDTPLKVAQYGISSAISIGDDGLIEKIRESYCEKFDRPFRAISTQTTDYRAKRITSYLNLMEQLVREKFEKLKKSFSDKDGELKKYLDMLPDFSGLKQKFNQIIAENNLPYIHQWVNENLKMGDIDVNIMTKADRPNYVKNKKLPIEFNNAHASIRGFAESNLSSSLILSAGLNPRLYSYLSSFQDFYLNEKGVFKKKIILKVSDYRSALIQGKFLAKKGLWVSEYRIESGLNCGGHVFPTEGYLMGPILEEFKNKRAELILTIFELYADALKNKKKLTPATPPPIKITAQGGVGTANEHHFLLKHYGLDSVGWGTPFLLVPEATNVDSVTLQLLKDAREKDLYLSNISPLGVRFHSLQQNSKERERQAFQDKGRPGSPCPKEFLALNTEFSEKGLCTASRKYQYQKIKELEAKKLQPEQHQKAYDKIVEKTCLCVGLGTAALLVNKLDNKVEKEGVSICPGPNLSYFSETVSLAEMVSHIYGRKNIIKRNDRPHFFVKELRLYLDYLKEKINEGPFPDGDKQISYQHNFRDNLLAGVEYYKNLFDTLKSNVDHQWKTIVEDFEKIKMELENM